MGGQNLSFLFFYVEKSEFTAMFSFFKSVGLCLVPAVAAVAAAVIAVAAAVSVADAGKNEIKLYIFVYRLARKRVTFIHFAT